MAPIKSPSKFSPNLLKPSDLFVMRRKRKGSPSTHLTESGPRKKLFVSPLKCINFNSPAKNYKSPKLSRRKGTTPRKTPKKTPRKIVTEESSVPLSDLLDEDANIEAPTICKKEKNDGLTRIPIDWTLKTRLRFFSYKPFPFKGYFTATESAMGTTSFARCIPTAVSKDTSQDAKPATTLKPSLSSSSLMSTSDTTATVDISATALLKKHCFVWRFPHLPGFDLFPRINNRCKLAPISRLMSEDLLHEYCASLKELYDLIRARQCAYFYLCAHSFTALFQAPGVGGIDETHVYLTPTSDGFRKLLKEEGIEFSMPLLEKEIELSKQKAEADAQKEKVLNEEILGPTSVLDEDEDASNFLESIGVSIQESSSINKPKRAKSQAKRNVNSTLVLIKGSNAQDLIPFLSNSKIILTTTGSLAYVPPTLLAPVAFEGAQLHFLKLKQNNLSEKTSSMYSLEIRGPILPNMVDSLCELFKTTLGDFSATLVNYDYCSPMATIHSIAKEEDKKDDPSKTIFASESLRDCGLGQQFILDSCSKINQSTISQTTISCKNGKYFVK